mmetsp:Transcript_2283/g.3173  ORF Transcript_2283/g.3173 Transcript_2283/m.3173 type:complete len:337 (+) Transcript_2283:65-1075(+)
MSTLIPFEHPYDLYDPTDALDKAISKLERNYSVFRDHIDPNEKSNSIFHFVSDKVSKAKTYFSAYEPSHSNVALQREFESLAEELRDLEKRREKIRCRKELISNQRKRILELKQKHQEKIARLTHQRQIATEELLSIQARKRDLTLMLDATSSINVINDCFHIWHDKQFATISGFRLGHKGNRIEWHETNSALGQAAMILKLVSNLMRFEFRTYIIYPMGCYSKLLLVEDRRIVLPLYMDDRFYIMKRSNFNKALQAFLECLKEAGDKVEKSDPTLQLPYKIEGDNIGNYQVILGNEDNWTRAMKYIATDLKWLIAWVSKYGSFYTVKPARNLASS